MALIAIASDKGAPGVTTAALALAAVWPRPVLLAECDPAGGDLAYRFPAAAGGQLDPRRGVLSLAVTARRGVQPNQVWEHVQKLHGGLDVLAGVTNAEQGAGLSLLWGQIGKALAGLSQADVLADCGRLGADGPVYDLLAEATTVVLVSRPGVSDVIRLRDRAAAFAAAAESRGRRGFGASVLIVARQRNLGPALGEVQHVLTQAKVPATMIGGLAHDPKGATLFAGGMGGKLERTALIKSARAVAQHLVGGLPPAPAQAHGAPAQAHGAPAQAYGAPAHAAAVAAAQQATVFPPSQGRHHAPAMGTPLDPASPGTGPQPQMQPAVGSAAGSVPGSAAGSATSPVPGLAPGRAAGPVAGSAAGHMAGIAAFGMPPQTQMQHVASPPPGSPPWHAQAPSITPGQALPAPDDWAAAERHKWRERERQQSGGA